MGRMGNEGVCRIPCIEKVILRGVLRDLGALLLVEGDIPLGMCLKDAQMIFCPSCGPAFGPLGGRFNDECAFDRFEKRRLLPIQL